MRHTPTRKNELKRIDKSVDNPKRNTILIPIEDLEYEPLHPIHTSEYMYYFYKDNQKIIKEMMKGKTRVSDYFKKINDDYNKNKYHIKNSEENRRNWLKNNK